LLFILGMAGLPAMAQQQNYVTYDIDNFWKAYDKIVGTSDSAQQYRYINEEYIGKASAGLEGMMQVREYTAKSYVDAINSYPKYWASIRNNTLKARSLAEGIGSGIEKLKLLYPALRPANLYFVIGALRSPGTISDGKILIGSELALADEHTITSEFPSSRDHLKDYFKSNPINNTVFLNVHEYVHTQQKVPEYILLYQSIYEGVAEFVAEKATGAISTTPAIAYGKKHEQQVKEKFIKEMFSPYTSNWLYNSRQNVFDTRDLGYYVGYAICENYYNKANDKKRAIKEMIELDYSNEAAFEKFITASGYFPVTLRTARAMYEKSRPVVIGIKEFKNGSKAVDAKLSRISIEFSTPMDTRYRSFELGPLGIDNLLRMAGFVGFSEDGKTASFDIKLEPGKQYQVIIGEGFRSLDAVPLQPYLVDFTTVK
jgi:hypothetical protein